MPGAIGGDGSDFADKEVLLGSCGVFRVAIFDTQPLVDRAQPLPQPEAHGDLFFSLATSVILPTSQLHRFQ